MKIIPAISRNYSISVAEPHRHIRSQDFTTVLSLSQVSHQVRAELGEMFWSNIYVDIDHWEYLFIDFLEDRPDVHQSIKKLRMEWSCEISPSELDGHIIEFCEYLSKHLILDE
jgi:hypothetical protein